MVEGGCNELFPEWTPLISCEYICIQLFFYSDSPTETPYFNMSAANIYIPWLLAKQK